jgi:hypothetical protein
MINDGLWVSGQVGGWTDVRDMMNEWRDGWIYGGWVDDRWTDHWQMMNGWMNECHLTDKWVTGQTYGWQRQTSCQANRYWYLLKYFLLGSKIRGTICICVNGHWRGNSVSLHSSVMAEPDTHKDNQSYTDQCDAFWENLRSTLTHTHTCHETLFWRILEQTKYQKKLKASDCGGRGRPLPCWEPLSCSSVTSLLWDFTLLGSSVTSLI